MTAYYNEIDPYAAQWLRNLIEAGHIAPGYVDERSIEDVYPSDLRGFTLIQGLIASSSCGLAAGGMSGKEPKPSQATCNLKCFGLCRFFHVPGGAQFPGLYFLHKIRSTLARLGLCGKNESGLSLEAASLSFSPCTSYPYRGSPHETHAPSDYFLISCIRLSKAFAGLHQALQKIAFCTLNTPLASMCPFQRLPTYTRPRTLANSKGFWSALFRIATSNECKSFCACGKVIY